MRTKLWDNFNYFNKLVRTAHPTNMSHYLRYYSGTMYFFTLVAFERRNIFCKPDFLSAFKTSIQEVRKQYPFEIIAWVQLPDHLHCILQFRQPEIPFGHIWSIIKRKTTQSCPQYHSNNHDLSLYKVLRNEKRHFPKKILRTPSPR